METAPNRERESGRDRLADRDCRGLAGLGVSALLSGRRAVWVQVPPGFSSSQSPRWESNPDHSLTRGVRSPTPQGPKLHLHSEENFVEIGKSALLQERPKNVLRPSGFVQSRFKSLDRRHLRLLIRRASPFGPLHPLGRRAPGDPLQVAPPRVLLRGLPPHLAKTTRWPRLSVCSLKGSIPLHKSGWPPILWKSRRTLFTDYPSLE